METFRSPPIRPGPDRLKPSYEGWKLERGADNALRIRVSSLPMRDGNISFAAHTTRARSRLKPSYEGWKLRQLPGVRDEIGPSQAFL